MNTQSPKVEIRALFRSKQPVEYVDDELGAVRVVHSARAKLVRLRLSDDGSISVTLPQFASIRHAHEIVNSSRESIRSWRTAHPRKHVVFRHGDRVGQSHTVQFIAEQRASTQVARNKLTIVVRHPLTVPHDDPSVQRSLAPYIARVLQKEARAYLPRRLSYLATRHGFSYEKVRYGTQKGRWGSCSSRGTISLNVGLMLLEPELIDYVLIHELCHTKHMNHSPQFWSLVESCLPHYRAMRLDLKQRSPSFGSL